jgi:hypothetical protein
VRERERERESARARALRCVCARSSLCVRARVASLDDVLVMDIDVYVDAHTNTQTHLR